jgi:hypothetical protein
MTPPDRMPWSVRGAGRSGVSMVTRFVMERAVAGEAAAAASTGGHAAAARVRAWLDAVEANFAGVRTWLP